MIQHIEDRFFEGRGQKVMLDFDLAQLYGIETKRLKEAVRRNLDRFPNDFMFELNQEEFENLRSQFASSSTWGGRRYLPYVFTEQGVAMLSSVLNSPQAIQVNIQIVRAFVLMRQYALSHKDLSDQLRELESKYDTQFKDVYEALQYLLNKDQAEIKHRDRNRIGFRIGKETEE